MVDNFFPYFITTMAIFVFSAFIWVTLEKRRILREIELSDGISPLTYCYECIDDFELRSSYDDDSSVAAAAAAATAGCGASGSC